ncbi:hypothetical protein EJB05_29091 [Eragrostis curvula]|uniref:Uncharacterized protein n=1 Tax=Eragrostis curvula TaxID=38414 RepID=A0A5J9URN9_9POAL|nr:hypothetical protein EJB05_29091 [Eragrostis curvula]
MCALASTCSAPCSGRPTAGRCFISSASISSPPLLMRLDARDLYATAVVIGGLWSVLMQFLSLGLVTMHPLLSAIDLMLSCCSSCSYEVANAPIAFWSDSEEKERSSGLRPKFSRLHQQDYSGLVYSLLCSYPIAINLRRVDDSYMVNFRMIEPGVMLEATDACVSMKVEIWPRVPHLPISTVGHGDYISESMADTSSASEDCEDGAEVEQPECGNHAAG